jgi:hypothetical protein
MSAEIYKLPFDAWSLGRQIVAAQDVVASLQADPDATLDQRVEANLAVARLMRRLIDRLGSSPA